MCRTEAGLRAVPPAADCMRRIRGPEDSYSVSSEPVRLEISGGFVRSIEGGEQARFLSDLLSAQDDLWVYNVAHFAVGLNPDCRDFTGEMLNDEGVDGTVHLGVGTSANLGGEVQAKTHFDAIIREPSIWLDGQSLPLPTHPV